MDDHRSPWGIDENASWLVQLIDLSAVAALPGCFLLMIPSIFLPGYALDKGWTALIVLVAVLVVAMAVLSARTEKNAGAWAKRTLLRSLGMVLLVGHFVFLVLHFVNRLADGSPVRQVAADVLEVKRPSGKSRGKTWLRLSGEQQRYRLSRGMGEKGRVLWLKVRAGALGWRWIEHP